MLCLKDWVILSSFGSRTRFFSAIYTATLDTLASHHWTDKAWFQALLSVDCNVTCCLFIYSCKNKTVTLRYLTSFLLCSSESARRLVTENITAILILPAPLIRRIFGECSMIAGTLSRGCTYGSTNCCKHSLGAYRVYRVNNNKMCVCSHAWRHRVCKKNL